MDESSLSPPPGMALQLPAEILCQILKTSLCNLVSPAVLMTTCSIFRVIAERILYTQLYFKSKAQLCSFISIYRSQTAPHAPRTIEVVITGEESQLVFTDLFALFSDCLSLPLDGAERDELGRISLDLLCLRLNSHAFDKRIEMIYSALSLIKCVDIHSFLEQLFMIIAQPSSFHLDGCGPSAPLFIGCQISFSPFLLLLIKVYRSFHQHFATPSMP